MEEMEAAVNAATSDAVKIWMNWMLIIFVASVLFVYKHISARFILGAFVLTLPIAIFIFKQTQSPHLLGISHIIVWLPLAIYLIKTEVMGKVEKLKSVYGVYLILLLVTIAISLVFDIRDTALILLGYKSAI